MAQDSLGLSAGLSRLNPGNLLNPGNPLVPGNLSGNRTDLLSSSSNDLRLGSQSSQGAPISLQKGKHFC